MQRCHGGMRSSFGNFISKERSKSIRKRKDEEEVGNGDVDLRWSSLLTVCQR